MTTVKMDQSNYGRQFGNTAYGNTTVFTFSLKCDTNGEMLDADSEATLKIADVVDLGPLPEGMRLDDAQTLVHAVMTDAATGKLGFKYEDGEDDANVPQDAEYFGTTAIDMATLGRVRATGTKSVILPKPARLILTHGGAENVKPASVTFLVMGELLGPR